MLKSLRMTFALLAMCAALAPPAFAQQSPKPQESPWAMRAPAAIPQSAATLSAAQLAAEKGTTTQQELAHRVVNAMYDKDFAAMKKLFAPSTLACIGNHDDFLHERIKSQFDLPISKDYQLTITKLPPNVMKATKYVTYPMPATHLMAIEFATEGGTDTVNETIGQEDDKWYEVQPCPTELGLQRFAKKQQERAQGVAKAKAAMANIREPLKSELLALIAKRDNADAWKLCMSSLHVDYPTAHGIVAILAGQEAD
jgi:hypothetical protein